MTRPKDLLDNATPSANSLAAVGLLRLAALTGDGGATPSGPRPSCGCWARPAVRHPTALGHLLAALDLWNQRHRPRWRWWATDPTWCEVVTGRYLPNAVLAWGEPYPSPLWDDRDPGADGAGQAYVCRNFACQAPVGDRRGPGRPARRLTATRAPISEQTKAPAWVVMRMAPSRARRSTTALRRRPWPGPVGVAGTHEGQVSHAGCEAHQRLGVGHDQLAQVVAPLDLVEHPLQVGAAALQAEADRRAHEVGPTGGLAQQPVELDEVVQTVGHRQQHAARHEHPADLGQRPGQIGHVVQHVVGHHHLGAGRAQGQRGRVEAHPRRRRRLGPGGGQHALGQVGSHQVQAWAPSPQPGQVRARSAAQVDHGARGRPLHLVEGPAVEVRSRILVVVDGSAGLELVRQA